MEFENVIELIRADIDSLKDAYHQEKILDRKIVYSTRSVRVLQSNKKTKIN